MRPLSSAEAVNISFLRTVSERYCRGGYQPPGSKSHKIRLFFGESVTLYPAGG